MSAISNGLAPAASARVAYGTNRQVSTNKQAARRIPFKYQAGTGSSCKARKREAGLKVYFVRHGIAAGREEFSGNDAQRPLTAEGKEKMARQARALRHLDLKLDAIVTSPLLRAKQTAEILARELGLRERLFEDKRAGTEFDSAQLAAILQQYSDKDSIAIVGHEPSMSQTIGRAIGGGNVEMKKGAVACVEMQHPLDTAATLLWLAPPRVLSSH